MAGGERKYRRKGNVLIVAVKLSRTSREVLTWTLAKFADPGDHVIALHVTSPPPEAESWRNNQDTENQQIRDIFDSSNDIYEGFCSMKQIDLQVKVTSGPSLRKVLIEEAKTCNAAKLILGTTSNQIPLGTSFSVTKYCAKRLPWTCSVLVMQHGRIVFQKQGNLAVGSSRMQDAKQQPKKSQSCNVMRFRHAPGKWANILEPLFDLQKEGGLVGYSSNAYDDAFHHWSLSRRYTDIPVSVFHSFKYVPPPLPSPRRFQNREVPNSISLSSLDTSRLQFQEETKILGAKKGSIEIQSSKEHESPGSCPYQNDPSHQCVQKNIIGSANIGQKTATKIFSPAKNSELKSGKSAESSQSVLSEVLTGQQLDRLKSRMPPGWPLLHRSISMNTTNRSCSNARGMSVVEWALQLPDRPKEVLKQLKDLEVTDMSEPSSFKKTTTKLGEFSETEEQRWGENGGKLISTNLNKTPLPCYDERAEKPTEVPGLVRQSFSCRAFQLLDLQTATNNFFKGNLVGEGGCSRVYRGVLPDGRVIAVKCLNTSATDSELEFFTEIEIVNGLQHRHIVQLLGYCVNSQQYFLVYDFASEGNLQQKLHDKSILPWNVRYKIAIGVAEALDYLHNKCATPVIHRDVKSSNVLLSSDLAPQLTDFGLAKLAPTNVPYITCSDVVGTFGYLAPEYFMYGKVNEKTDVYSFGVVLLELITGKHPIDTANPRGHENLAAWSRPLLEDESSYHRLVDPSLEGAFNADQLTILATAAALCLRQSPHARPRMSRILRLLTGECDDLENLVREDAICREIDEGFELPNYGDCNIRSHLTLALVGLDDDVASQASIDYSMDLADSSYLDEYLRGRYSRTGSLE